MSKILTSKMKIESAQLFAGSFSSNPTYVCVGQTIDWIGSSTPVDTVQSELDLMRNSIGGKRIQSADVILSTKRHDWVSGSTYTQYDSSDSALFSKSFYVVADFNVYKCLFNNFNALSTIKPTGTSVNHIITSDGYVWKYMYSVAPQHVIKFDNSAYIPVVSNQVISNSAIKGQIFSVVVTSGGTGYTNGNINITISGDGSGAAGIATVSGGVVTSIIMTNVGHGYTYANISVAGGSGLVARANLSPILGHGSDVYKELGCYYVMTSTTLDSIELNTSNDFRSIYLLRNPISNSGTSYTASIFNALTTLSVASTAGFSIDDLVTSSSASGRIVGINAGSLVIGDIEGTFVAGGLSSSSTNTTITSISNPDISVINGDVLYIDQRTISIQRSVDQTEVVQIVFKF